MAASPDLRVPDEVRTRSVLQSPMLRVLGVLAVSTVLRPPVAGVGPVIDDIQHGLGLPGPAVSLLTALPVMCFGLGAFAGPGLARRLGIDGAVVAVLTLVAAALLLRVGFGTAALFVGTIAAGAGIAVANVLLPAVVKQDFPTRVGLMTGLYTSVLSGAAAVAALVAVPLESWTGAGWRGSLLVWGGVAVLVLLAWLPQLRAGHARPQDAHAPHPASALLKNRRALAVAAFMGFQSLGFYAVLTWLPSLLHDTGYSPSASGALLSLATVLGIPASLLVPGLAARHPGQRAWVVGVSLLTGGGFLGLLVAPSSATLLWVVLIGLGQGASFPLALLLIVLRSSNPTVAGQLSAMAQGIGYLLAGTGPFLVGAVHAAAGTWRPSLTLLLLAVAAQIVAGLSAGRRGTAV